MEKQKQQEKEANQYFLSTIHSEEKLYTKSDWLKYMEKRWGKNGSKLNIEKVKAFFRTIITKNGNGGVIEIRTQKLPTEMDLPNWLISNKLEESKAIKDSNYTMVFNSILGASKNLSHGEVRLWGLIRMRVTDKSREGYYKKPALLTSLSLYAQWLGIAKINAGVLMRRLEKKGAIRKVKKGRGQVDEIWLVEISQWIDKIDKVKVKGVVRGVIKSMLFSQKIMNKILNSIKGEN